MNKRKIILAFLTLLFILMVMPKNTVSAATTTLLKINDTALEFNKVIYVDGVGGDDTNGDGNMNKPFQTIVKAFDYLNDNYRQGGAIIIKDGTYDVSALFQGTSNNLNSRYDGMKLSLIAETMGKVQFNNVGEWMLIQNSSTARIKVSLYGIIFNTIKGGWYYMGGDDWTNEFYNCVLAGGYGGAKNAIVKVENSLYIGSPNGSASYEPVFGSATNCASTSNYIEPDKGTITTSLYNVTIDSNYNITSDGWQNADSGTNPDGSVANIGVYGGQFAWGSMVSEISNGIPSGLVAVPVNNNKQIDLHWNTVSGSAISYNVYRSETQGAGYQIVGTTASSSFTDADSILSYDKTYYYVVTEVDADVESEFSIEASALPIKPVSNLKLVLEKNEERQLSIADELIDNTEMTWISSNTSIASVDSTGKVKALAPGSTIITCTSKDGSYTDTINILVVDLNYQLAVDLTVGETCRLTIDDLTNTTNVTWTAYDPSIATVSSNGKVTSVNAGLTYITAIDSEGNEIGRIYIRVR